MLAGAKPLREQLTANMNIVSTSFRRHPEHFQLRREARRGDPQQQSQTKVKFYVTMPLKQ